MPLTWYVGVSWGVNLTSNPGFEAAGDWGNWGTATVDGTCALDGSVMHGDLQSAKLTCGASASYSSAYVYQSLAVTPGHYYEVSFWTRGNGVAGYYWIGTSTPFEVGNLVPLTSTGISGTTFQRVRKVVYVPPTWPSAMVLYLTCPALNGGIAYYDDVVVSEFQPEQDRMLSVDCQRGRASVFERMQPGRLRLTLDNSSGRYDPWDTFGALYGYLVPSKPILVRVNDGDFTELLTNGSMEDGDPPTGWTTYDATAASAVWCHDGSAGMYLTATANGGRAQQTATVVPGRWYRYEVWVSLTNATNARLVVRDVTNGAAIYNGTYAAYTGWDILHGTFRAPKGCTTVSIILQLQTSGGKAYFDGATLTDTYAPLFYGKLTDMRPLGSVSDKKVVLDALDGLHDLEAKERSYVEYQSSIRTDQGVTAILDELGWLTGSDWRDLDDGDVTLGSWWAAGSALDAIHYLEDAEHGAFYVAARGAATFVDRTTYVGTTPLGELSESSIEDIMPTMPWDHIRNEVVVAANILRASTETTEFVGNGDMELGDPPGGWLAVNATLDSYAGSKHGGAAAMSVAASASPGSGRQSVQVTPGDTMGISGWMLRSAAGHRGRFRIYDVNNAANIWAPAYTESSSWTESTQTITIPAGCYLIHVFCETETSGETVYFDDVSLTGVARELWSYDETPSLAIGASMTIWAEYQDEFGQVCPASVVYDAAAYVDYTANAAADGSGADMTADMAVTTTVYGDIARIDLENDLGAAPLYITKLSLRGISLRVIPAQAIVEDVDSQEAYGKQALLVDTPFIQTRAIANTLATALETYYDAPLKAPTVRMEMLFPTMTSYDLMENIAFTAETYDIDETMRIGQIHWWTGDTPQTLFCDWALEPVPS